MYRDRQASSWTVNLWHSGGFPCPCTKRRKILLIFIEDVEYLLPVKFVESILRCRGKLNTYMYLSQSEPCLLKEQSENTKDVDDVEYFIPNNLIKICWAVFEEKSKIWKTNDRSTTDNVRSLENYVLKQTHKKSFVYLKKNTYPPMKNS